MIRVLVVGFVLAMSACAQEYDPKKTETFLESATGVGDAALEFATGGEVIGEGEEGTIPGGGEEDAVTEDDARGLAEEDFDFPGDVLVGPKVTGRPLASATPEPLGPRNWGQSAGWAREMLRAASRPRRRWLMT